VHAFVRQRWRCKGFGRRHFGNRIYFVNRGADLVILLAGGDKHTQERDIAAARELARNL
jgi:putative addiction module killer protein